MTDYNGILGVNATDYGLSRENVIADVRQIGGALLLVRNSPELAALALAAGVPFVVYRETDDDPQHSPLGQSPVEFVQKRARNAPPGAYLHLTNELDPSPALNDWTNAALDECDRLGRKACAFNFSTHKSRAQYDVSAPVIERAVKGGHAMGVHVYETPIFDIDFDAYQWTEVMDKIGGVWLVTEYAYIANVRNDSVGYREAISEDEHMQFIRYHGGFLAQLGTPAAWFSYEHWRDNEQGRREGFGFLDRPYVMDAMRETNAACPYQPAEPPRPAFQTGIARLIGVSGVNIRQAPNATAARLATLADGQSVKYLPGLVQGGAYTAHGASRTTWIALEQGFVASAFVRFEDADPLALENAALRLEVARLTALLADRTAELERVAASWKL